MIWLSEHDMVLFSEKAQDVNFKTISSDENDYNIYIKHPVFNT